MQAIQHYLGHRNIQHTTRYTELASDRFKNFWHDNIVRVDGIFWGLGLHPQLERGLQVLLEEGRSLIEAVGIPESRLQQMMDDQTTLIEHLRSHPSLVTASAQKEQENLIEVLSRYEEKQWDKPQEERITRHGLRHRS